MKIVLGVDIGGSHIGFGFVSKDHILLHEYHQDHDNSLDSDAYVQLCLDIIHRILSENTSWDLIAVGVGCPGHCKNGILMRAANLPFKEYPLANAFSQRLNVPATLLNDADAAIAAEVWSKQTLSSYSSYSNIAMITIGTGIGLGLILNNRLFRGSNGLIEGGHAIMHPSSEKVCSCGQRGCIELTASAKNTTARYNARITGMESRHPANGAKDIFEKAANGDEIAVAVLEETAEALAIMSINISRIVDPDVIILGGGMAQAGEKLLEMVNRHIQRLTWTCLPTYFKVVIAHSADKAGMIGAAIAAEQEHSHI